MGVKLRVFNTAIYGEKVPVFFKSFEQCILRCDVVDYSSA